MSQDDGLHRALEALPRELAARLTMGNGSTYEKYVVDAEKLDAILAEHPPGDSRALRDLQAEQVPWVKHNFGDRPAWMPLLGAVEELGELAHAHLKEAQGIRVSENHVEKAKDAIADIVIYLADYCSARGFDLESLVTETWAKVKLRDWKADPAHADHPGEKGERVQTYADGILISDAPATGEGKPGGVGEWSGEKPF